MEILIALVVILIALWIGWRWRTTTTFQRLNIPGPEPSLFFGNLLEMYKKGPLECHKEWVKKYGRVVGYYYGMTPALLITDPQLLKNIFIRDFHKFINRENFNPLFPYDPHSIKGRSVLNLPGQAWKDVRGVLTPTFTTAKMKQMAGSMNASISQLINTLEEASESDAPFDVYDAYQRLTMDVITRTAFGVITDVQTNSKSRVMEFSRTIFKTAFTDPLTFIGMCFPWTAFLCLKLHELRMAIEHRGIFPNKRLIKGIKQVLEHRKKNPQGRKSDLLQLMIDAKIPVGGVSEMSKLEAGNLENEKQYDTESNKSTNSPEDDRPTRGMEERDITASAFVVFLAGYETTSTALGFTSYLIAKHQNVQETLFNEIEELIKSGQTLEYSTVNKLPYLDKVLSESMRICPPVYYFTNRWCVETAQYGDLKIPKGMLIHAPAFLMHHDPEFWTDPETFDPERFNEKPNSDGVTYLPFGVGPRNCLGMRFAQLEAKLALANVVHKFKFELADKKRGTLLEEPFLVVP